MQILSTQLQMSNSQTQLALKARHGRWGRTRAAACRSVSLELYFLEAPGSLLAHLPCGQPSSSLRRQWSELSGDDGEGQHWAAGLQLKGSEEAVNSSLALALSLQHLAQALPRLMASALPLHGVPQHLLGQALVAQPTQHQTLGIKHRAGLVKVSWGGASWCWDKEYEAVGHPPDKAPSLRLADGCILYSCKSYLSPP